MVMSPPPILYLHGTEHGMMEVEYTGGGVLIFSFLIFLLYINVTTLGVCVEPI